MWIYCWCKTLEWILIKWYSCDDNDNDDDDKKNYIFDLFNIDTVELFAYIYKPIKLTQQTDKPIKVEKKKKILKWGWLISEVSSWMAWVHLITTAVLRIFSVLSVQIELCFLFQYFERLLKVSFKKRRLLLIVFNPVHDFRNHQNNGWLSFNYSELYESIHITNQKINKSIVQLVTSLTECTQTNEVIKYWEIETLSNVLCVNQLKNLCLIPITIWN